ncbi:hypothetical protein I3843_10G047400 [Carya illinoinensis]|nr:hypothetical protein I3843_10G047400 [Carya illinoinensis]
MLGIFNKDLVQPPRELNSPAAPAPSNSSAKSKLSHEILKSFVSQSSNAFSISFENATSFAYVTPEKPYSIHQRLLCCMDDIYCISWGT